MSKRFLPALVSRPDEIRPKSQGGSLPPVAFFNNLSDRLQAVGILGALIVGLGAGPVWGQVRRAGVGYQLTGGPEGYASHEARLDLSGRVFDSLGFYGGGTVLADRVYQEVYAGAGGLEFHVGDEDRLRLGGHLSGGHFRDLAGDLKSSGLEFGYLTQVGPLYSVGLFYRFTEGTLVPVSAMRSAQVSPSPFSVPGRRDNTLRDHLKPRPIFQVHEFTVAGTFALDDAAEAAFLDLAVTAVVLSNIGPAVAETASFTFPIFTPVHAFLSGTLEQSSTLGSLQFGSLGLYLQFGDRQAE